MKARIKATGDIVDIYRFVDTEQNEWIDCYLDFLEPIDTDYWTRLEHQAGIAAMQGMLSNPEVNLDYKSYECMPQAVAATAYTIAHALVEKYKKEEK